MRTDERKTSRDHWDNFYSANPRFRLPSKLIVATRNLQRLLKPHINRGDKVLEIGFAPGKQLAYIAKQYGADVAGVDYSDTGIAIARKLFAELGIVGDLRKEDIFRTSFEAGTFDFIYSVGVIEHFNDPRELVRIHVDLLKPGGVTLILIPNYGGHYGKLQKYFDPENLLIHNLKIMTCEAMRDLAPADLADEVRAFKSGRIDPSQLSLGQKWPRQVAKVFHLFFTALGGLQPFDIPALCPWIGLEIRKKQA